MNQNLRFPHPFFVVLLVLLCSSSMFAQAEVRYAKPTMAVIDFQTRPKVHYLAGRELSDALVDALLETNRYTVVDRSRTGALQQEQREALIGRVDPATGASVGKMLGAEYLIVGTVTEFEEKKAGGLGILNKVVPGGLGDKVVSYRGIVKFTLQVIHSTTGEIKFSKAFEKEASAGGLSGSGSVFDIPEFKSKAIQDATVMAMQEAVAYLGERIKLEPVAATMAATSSVAAGPVNCSAVTGSKPLRIMVVIPEVHITQKIPDPAGETEIIKKLVGQGFNVVDQGQIAVIRNRESVLAATKNPQAAAALGVEYGADVIVIGEAFSEFADRSGGMVATRARVEARAIQTDTARIIAADGKFGSGLDIAEFVSAKTALRNAGTLWADYFLGTLCKSPIIARTEFLPQGAAAPAAVPTASANSVEVMISNISFTQLKQIGDQIEKIRGVSGVTKKFTDGIARLDILYSGNAESLADAISETRFGLLKVNIVGLTGNKIEIAIGK